MSDYAVGDLQGCYDPLMRLLDKLQFNEQVDRLWFVGDLVNRGPDSLRVLRFIRSLPVQPRITLGNHDLHLLASLFAEQPWKGHDDTLHLILEAEDGEELGHWLRTQSILYYEPELNVLMSHAGIAPKWDLTTAINYARELEAVLAGPNFRFFLNQMYGNKPHAWSDALDAIDRLRLITNYFTRMRYCDIEGHLVLDFKGPLDQAPAGLYPWYEVPHRVILREDIIFGHWAALGGISSDPKIHAIDTGCLWGGTLTALCLQTKQRTEVPGRQ